MSTIKRIPLLGRLVRVVAWHGHRKLVSAPGLVLEEKTGAVLVASPKGPVWAYPREVEIVGHEPGPLSADQPDLSGKPLARRGFGSRVDHARRVGRPPSGVGSTDPADLANPCGSRSSP